RRVSSLHPEAEACVIDYGINSGHGMERGIAWVEVLLGLKQPPLKLWDAATGARASFNLNAISDEALLPFDEIMQRGIVIAEESPNIFLTASLASPFELRLKPALIAIYEVIEKRLFYEECTG